MYAIVTVTKLMMLSELLSLIHYYDRIEYIAQSNDIFVNYVNERALNLIDNIMIII